MFVENIFYYIYEGVEDVCQFFQSYDVVVDEVKSFTVSQILSFIVFCHEEMVVHYAHIWKM